MLFAILFVVLGLVGLAFGGDILVRGASRLATLAGISPLVVGLTIVAFGTSAPELAVSVSANMAGQEDLAIGNIVGSNNFNILFVLGSSAIVAPLVVSRQLVRFDVPIMILAAFALFGMCLDGKINRWDGLILFSALLIYISWSIYQSRRASRKEAEANEEVPPRSLKQVLIELGFLVGGICLLTVGSKLLVMGASDLARMLGMSELLIGLTIVAIGTSLPEVAASITATLKGEREIAVGNVVGSNIFNVLCVIGLSALVAPRSIEVGGAALYFDIPLMVGVSVACLPIFITGGRISRLEGSFFLFYYLAYMVYLILAALYPEISDNFALTVLLFAAPITIFTLSVSIVREYEKRKLQRLELEKKKAAVETIEDSGSN